MVSIGANDVKFSEVVKQCIVSEVTDPRPCHLSGTRSRVTKRLGTLPARYAALAMALAGMGVEPGRVHISEYFDPTVDDLGLPDLRCVLNAEQIGEYADYLADVAEVAGDAVKDPRFASVLKGVEFAGEAVSAALDGGLVTDDETAWARTSVVGWLNASVALAAQTNGWHFVGGIAAAFDRHGYCAEDSWVVRLGEEEGKEALKEPHVKEFDITGRPMRNWVLVGPEGVQDDEQLSAWIQRAVKFVGALPAKEK